MIGKSNTWNRYVGDKMPMCCVDVIQTRVTKKGIHHSKKGRGELKLGLPYYMKFSRISQYKKNREIKVTRTISVANTTGREN